MYSIVKGMTGAQIKNLAEICASYAASNAIEKITFDVLKKVKEIIKDTLKDVDEFADMESLGHGRKEIGFPSANKESETLLFPLEEPNVF